MEPKTGPQDFGRRRGAKARIAKNTLIYGTWQLVSWVVSFAAVSLIPRTLGEKVMGHIALAGNATSLSASFYRFGVESSLTAEIGRNPLQAERLLRSVLGLRIALQVPLILTSVMLLSIEGADAMLWVLGFWMIVTWMFQYMAEPMRSVLAGWELAAHVSIADLIATAGPLFAIPFLRPNYPLPYVVATTVIAIVGLLLRVWWLSRTIKLWPTFDWRLWIKIVRGGLPFVANGIVMNLYRFTTVVTLRLFTDHETVGIYAQSTRIFGTCLFFPTVVGYALLPNLARLAEANPEELRRLESRVLTLMIILSLPVMMLLFQLADPFSKLLYGPHKFLAMPLVLQVSSFTLIPVFVVTTMYNFLIARQKNASWSVFLLITVLLNWALCLILVPIFHRVGFHLPFGGGAVGAAVAQGIAEGVSMVFALSMLKINPLKRETCVRLLRALIATLGMGAAIRLTQIALPHVEPGMTRWIELVIAFLLPALMGTGTFIVLGKWLRILAPEEQARFAKLVRKAFLRPNSDPIA